MKGDDIQMKTLRKSLVFGLFCAVVLGLVAAAAAGPVRGWELLGTRTVTDRADHDSIAAGHQGTYRSIKITVQRRPVQFRDVKIHFANGEVQHVALRNVIPAGGESRVIDVEGHDRVIRSVEFWYDSQTRWRRAMVKVYGRNELLPSGDPAGRGGSPLDEPEDRLPEAGGGRGGFGPRGMARLLENHQRGTMPAVVAYQAVDSVRTHHDVTRAEDHQARYPGHAGSKKGSP